MKYNFIQIETSQPQTRSHTEIKGKESETSIDKPEKQSKTETNKRQKQKEEKKSQQPKKNNRSQKQKVNPPARVTRGKEKQLMETEKVTDSLRSRGKDHSKDEIPVSKKIKK